MLQYFNFCVLCVSLTFGPGLGNRDFGPQYPPTKGELWPKPFSQTKSDQYFTFNPSKFSVNVTDQTCGILTRALERYAFIARRTKYLEWFPRHAGRGGSRPDSPDTNNQGLLKHLEVRLSQPYVLVVTSNEATLLSSSIWGILRGLESWTQLFYLTDDANEVRINETRIVDRPRYSHRGLMLDTSRHYVSMYNILKTLDAMAMNKFNVFHWHIVDDSSFPYQSEKFPELSARGAYHPSMIYTKADIKKVVDFARDRGIRVVPEFDVPGHTRSWGEAYPFILTKCYGKDGTVQSLGPINPLNNDTYQLLSDLFNEIQDWFPDEYLHAGGDEVDMSCWASNPELQKYIKEHNMTDVSQLHGLFMSNVIPLLGDRSKPIIWQEVYDDGVSLPSNSLIQVWKNGWVDEMVKILNDDNRLIFSSSWYLDHLKTGGDWIDFWRADPRQMVSGKVDNSLLDNIVGGEACMWGEVVDDVNVISRTWPRASATAERLWSPALTRQWYREVADASLDAARRLEEHTCRMRRRGVRAQPPNGPGFCLGAV